MLSRGPGGIQDYIKPIKYMETGSTDQVIDRLNLNIHQVKKADWFPVRARNASRASCRASSSGNSKKKS